MTETYPLLQDILTKGATAASLLPGLKQRVLQTNGQISALERGRCIREQFPDLAVDRPSAPLHRQSAGMDRKSRER